MNKEAFLDGVKILEKIEETGHQAFFVGGSVRDLLLGREVGDVDITTSASPEYIQSLFPKVIPVGIEHGTVIVRYNHESYEVTTFRLDGNYSNQRHPDHVEFVSDVEEDLRRRDFTINAMAMDSSGRIIDLFNGKKDLKNKKIRTVGNGFDRFTEDPLRIIRALRFVSQLGLTIERDTFEDMKRVKGEIESLAVERVKNEMEKFFSGDYVEQGIVYLKKTGIYKHLPIFKDKPHLIENLNASFLPLHTFGEVVALFNYQDETISIVEWIKAWKCSNKEKNEALALSRALNYFNEYGLDPWLVYHLPHSLYSGFIRLVRSLFKSSKIDINELIYIDQNLPIHSKRDLAINGYDLVALCPHLKKGAWIRDVLSTFEKEVLFKRIPNTKDSMKEWIRCNPPETH